MKLKLTLCALIIFLVGAGSANAQQNNFDRDIWQIRQNDFSQFDYMYDDVLQYSPAGVMLAMKACGYESRSGWGRMLVSDAFSVAIMAGAVNGLKYTVRRPRPQGAHNSFPSGHTATAFMTATLLHKEYGWRSPWFSIGAYTVAATTAVSRIMNNKHWMTDLVGGAAIGIGSVHLGYYLSDLIFKDRYLAEGWSAPVFLYNPGEKHYVAELGFGYRFVLGGTGTGVGTDVGVDGKSSTDAGDTYYMPLHGGSVSLSADIPIVPNVGIKVRGSANSLVYSNSRTGGLISSESGTTDTGTASASNGRTTTAETTTATAGTATGSRTSVNIYTTTAGAYWNYFYAKRFEFQAHASAGAAFTPKSLFTDSPSGTSVSTTANAPASTPQPARLLPAKASATLSAGLGFSFLLDNNFKLKLFADYETISSPAGHPWMHSFILGWTSAWFW